MGLSGGTNTGGATVAPEGQTAHTAGCVTAKQGQGLTSQIQIRIIPLTHCV